MSDIQSLRESIPALESVSYCNYGASGPSPRSVIDAASASLETHEVDSHVSGDPYDEAYATYDRARASVAGVLETDPEAIAMTQSTTDGINRIACALEWEPGDVVVRTDLEHPAGILPWRRLERTRDVSVRVVESEAGRLDRQAYERAVEGASLVCLSALTWNYGTRLPVRELGAIAHDAGAFVLVDAVQWVGQAPVNVERWEVDAVAAAGHKWLLGPWGAGFLYVDSSVVHTLEPRTIGYRGVVEPTEREYELEPGAARFEVGTTSPAPYAGLVQAIDALEQIGFDRIEDRIEQLARSLTERLPADRVQSPLDPESGLITVAVSDPEQCVERLAREDIVIRALPDPEAVRVSLHAVTTMETVDHVVEGLEECWNE